MNIFLSLIIPAYNEAGRIGSSLDRIQDFLISQDYSSEVIIVDDGSTDNTVALAESYSKRYRDNGLILRAVSNPGNQGKGYSVRHGMLEARGEIALFSDADLSAPITEAPKLIAPIADNDCDIAFGSRGLDYGMIGVHQSFAREMAGRTFNLIMRFITGLNFKDTQCGFKAFRRQAALPIFGLQSINGFGFDVEVLFLAQKFGLRLKEIPVHWNHVEGTKVRMLSDSLKMFLDLLVIRRNDLLGRYDYAPGYSIVEG